VLHLTTIVEPAEIVERHLGESFEGAALIEPDASGVLVDLGSGNGYPGIPIAMARPDLRAVLVEASAKKARFLRGALERAELHGVRVVERRVGKAADLEDLAPIRVMTARALGDWERILPRVADALDDDHDARLLLWAGSTVETVCRRALWKRRLEPLSRHPLPGRARSWVWVFGKRT
jgi:16S rRNA (guanine527-N7)-methyltransferase